MAFIYVLCKRCLRTISVRIPAEESPVKVRCPDPECQTPQLVSLWPNQVKPKEEENDLPI